MLEKVREWTPMLPRCEVPMEWKHFKDRSIFRVEQDDFPLDVRWWTGGKRPSTDGETVWIPRSTEENCISFLLHESAHALLHYPNGPDPDLIDPIGGYASVMEAEACAAGYLAADSLGQVPLYNEIYLAKWDGDIRAFVRDSRVRVINAARRMALRFSEVDKAEQERFPLHNPRR